MASGAVMVTGVLVLVLAAAVRGLELTEQQYYSMPHMFLLDDYEECLSSRRGAFCLGSFDLMQYKNDRLLNMIQKYSSSRFHFNRSQIHRGFCLPTTCSHIEGVSLHVRFEQCVSNLTRTRYGLESNLTELKYCKTAKEAKVPRIVDGWDMAFAYVVGVILLLNVMGTAYDLLRNKDGKPIRQLEAWSLVANWKRLTADYSDGDPKLAALRPVQGIKAICMIFVMMAHTVLAFHLTYMYNPDYIEKASEKILASFLQNGTAIVQIFIMVSCFLLAYNLLLHAENTKKPFSISMLPMCLVNRIFRITPLYLFILGLATTWWAHASDGPLWGPLIEAEASRCRDLWWTNAFYANNLLQEQNFCLIHTWFLAVDMQLYIIAVVLTLLLGNHPRAAVKILLALILGSIALNLAICLQWELKPMVKLMVPESMRTGFAGEPSFKWVYTAPYGSLPSALVGLLVAFLHYNQQTDGYLPTESMFIRIIYRLWLPSLTLWIVGGYFLQRVTEPFWIHLYAAIDRPVYITIVAVAMYGFFNKIDLILWKLFSWRGWEILGRMSLSIYLVHWLFSLLLLGVRTNLSRVSIFDIGGHWLCTIFLTYWAALPLHLLIESPAMRFGRALMS